MPSICVRVCLCVCVCACAMCDWHNPHTSMYAYMCLYAYTQRVQLSFCKLTCKTASAGLFGCRCTHPLACDCVGFDGQPDSNTSST